MTDPDQIRSLRADAAFCAPLVRVAVAATGADHLPWLERIASNGGSHPR